MRKKRNGTQLLALLSHVFVFTTMFTIASGMFKDGVGAIPYFLVASLLAAFLHLGKFLRPPWNLLCGAAIYLGGIWVWIGLETTVNSAHMAIYLVLGLFLLSRLPETRDSFSFIREELLRYYRLDFALIIPMAFIAWIYEQDGRWQSVALPLFISYLVLRLAALASTVRVAEEGKRSGHFSRSLPFIVLAASLLSAWVLEALGLPVLTFLGNLLLIILGPIFYGAGMLSVALANWLSRFPMFLRLLEGEETREMGPDESAHLYHPEQEFQIPDWIPHLFLILLVGICAWIVYRQLLRRRKNALFYVDEKDEIREFIPRRRIAPAKRQRTVPPTPLRKIYQQFLRSMLKKGHVRHKGETALEHIEKIAATRSDQEDPMRELTHYYMNERYGGKEAKEEQERARQLLHLLTKKG